MNDRIDFDEIPLKKKFASFSLDDISGANSVFSIVKSLFEKETRNSWNNCFKYSLSEDGKECALLAGPCLYRISLIDGKFTFTNLGLINFDVSFVSSDDSLAILGADEITFYSRDNKPVKRLQNTNKSRKLILVNHVLFGVSKSSAVAIDNDNIKDIELGDWSICAHSLKSFCVVSKKVKIVNSDMSIITPKKEFKKPKDVSMSRNGQNIFVLDSDNTITVLSESSGFEPTATVSVPLCLQVIPWTNNNFVTYSVYGVISFFSLNGKQIRSKNATQGGVLKQTEDGFVFFEPQDCVGDNVHFDIIKFDPVSPFDLYQRSCENGIFDKALKLMNKFNFDSDIYYKAVLQKSELTRKIIDDNLKMIKDKDFVYDFCINAHVISPDIASSLITEGLRIKPEDPLLLQLRGRLEIFSKLGRQGFLESEWNAFKFCNIENEMKEWAKRGQFADVAKVFQFSKEVTEEMKNNVVKLISPFVEPSKYECLMPNNQQYFEKRAFEIDQITGQTDVIIDLLKIGAKKFSALKPMLEDAEEFDKFVVSSTNAEAARDLSLEEFIKLDESSKLYLYISDSKNGKEAAKILTNQASSLCRRNRNSVVQLCSKILSQEPIMFKSMNDEERVKEVFQVIDALSEKQQIALDIVSEATILLTKEVVKAFLTSWKPVLSNETVDFLHFVEFYNNFNEKNQSYSSMEKEISKDAITKTAEALINDKTLKLETWRSFMQCAKAVKKLAKDSSVDQKLRDANFRAMLVLEEWDEIEVNTPKEIDATIAFVEQTLASAKTCSVRDPNLSAATLCLGMIPDDSAPPRKKELYTKLQVYYAFDELDSNITPNTIETSNNPTALMLSVLAKHKDDGDLKSLYKKAMHLVKNVDGVQSDVINDFFAKMALDQENIEFGYSLIDSVSEQTVLQYVESQKWDDKEKKTNLCEQAIQKCSIDTIAGFVNCRENLYDPVVVSDSEIFLFVNKCNDAMVVDFALSKLSQPIQQSFAEFAKSYIVHNPEIPISLINKLVEMKQVDKEVEKQLNDTIPELIRALDSKKDQYQAMQQIVQQGKVKYPQLADVLARGFIAVHYKRDINLPLDKIAEKCQDLGFNINDIVKLAKKLKEIDGLTQDVAYKFAKSGFSISKNIISDNIEFWQSVLGEELEAKLVQETGDISIGLASKHKNVIDSARALLNSEGPLPTKVIDEIIGRKEAHILAGTPRFTQIQARVRTTQQLKDVFSSLQANNKRKELAEFIASFFSIPSVLANDYDEIIAIGDKLINA